MKIIVLGGTFFSSALAMNTFEENPNNLCRVNAYTHISDDIYGAHEPFHSASSSINLSNASESFKSENMKKQEMNIRDVISPKDGNPTIEIEGSEQKGWFSSFVSLFRGCCQ